MTRAPAPRSAVIVGMAARMLRVVGDLAVGERDVEVDPYEDPFVRDVDVADRQLVHVGQPSAGQAATGRRAPTNAIRSATRQL